MFMRQSMPNYSFLGWTDTLHRTCSLSATECPRPYRASPQGEERGTPGWRSTCRSLQHENLVHTCNKRGALVSIATKALVSTADNLMQKIREEEREKEKVFTDYFAL